MSKLEVIDENSFRITLVTQNLRDVIEQGAVCETPIFTHENIQWKIGFERDENKKLLYIFESHRKKDDWSVKLKLNIDISHNGAIVKDINAHSGWYNFNKSKLGGHIFTKPEDLEKLEKIWADEIKVETTVKIEEIKESRFFVNYEDRVQDFTEKKEDMDSVMIMIKDKELFVNKDVLRSFSPVFKDMLTENDFEDILVINDMEYDPFVEFLQLLHHCTGKITATNVEALLQLAQKYEVPFITEKCEVFLLNSTIDMAIKLTYAESYELRHLKNQVDDQESCKEDEIRKADQKRCEEEKAREADQKRCEEEKAREAEQKRREEEKARENQCKVENPSTAEKPKKKKTVASRIQSFIRNII